jgi:hypothetical protein
VANTTDARLVDALHERSLVSKTAEINDGIKEKSRHDR